MSGLICIGAVAGSFGVRGEVRLKSFCAVPEDIETYSPLQSEDGSQSFSVSLTRVTNNGFVAILGGIDTKEQADAIKGLRLFAPRDALPNLPDDEYYYSDLTGLDVYDTGGNLLGQVKSVMNHGAGDLLEVHGPGLKDTVLLPFTQEAVPTVDMVQRRIIADPPNGLF